MTYFGNTVHSLLLDNKSPFSDANFYVMLP